MKTGSESIEVTIRRGRILFAGFVASMEDTRLPRCVILGEMVGGAGCVGGGQEKEWMGCLLDDLRVSGRGGMALDGGTRDGTFHGEMDRCRESLG